uniref:Uncharacterized protein n=1 Tax=Rhizophora mucronata TaxID=61149 RepID=A0A2P2QD92_RHIMU
MHYIYSLIFSPFSALLP